MAVVLHQYTELRNDLCLEYLHLLLHVAAVTDVEVKYGAVEAFGWESPDICNRQTEASTDTSAMGEQQREDNSWYLVRGPGPSRAVGESW